MLKDDDGYELLNVKFYDKIIKLVARDGYLLVGRSITEILCCMMGVMCVTKRVITLDMKTTKNSEFSESTKN